MAPREQEKEGKKRKLNRFLPRITGPTLSENLICFLEKPKFFKQIEQTIDKGYHIVLVFRKLIKVFYSSLKRISDGGRNCFHYTV